MTDAFLQGLLDNPKNDESRLVYADWLDEQGDPDAQLKATFLRVTVKLATERCPKGKRKSLRKQLQELAANLDTSWLAIVSRLRIENCPVARQRVSPHGVGVPFQFLCERRWEDLQTTADKSVRSCDSCHQDVHYCDTITEARNHASMGNCIAIDLGVIRREGDLSSGGMWLGRPSPEMIREENERMQPDPVSAARDQRKRAKS